MCTQNYLLSASTTNMWCISMCRQENSAHSMNYEWINYHVYDKEIIISDSTAPSAGYSDDEQVS